ncbi:MAG TPA: winged helix-turn-helix domain-containing protein [Candidatus Angelobacter sp.]
MDLDSEEIRKSGLKVKLRCQPFRMLATIAENNGDVVTYEELRTQFWPTVAIDNYKHSLGNSMLEIRKVLDDPANKPRYIETVSRGYRFLIPVEFITPIAHENGSGNPLKGGLQAEMEKIGREFPITLRCRGLALLFYRCEGLLNLHPRDPNLPGLRLLMADIQSAIDRSRA